MSLSREGQVRLLFEHVLQKLLDKPVLSRLFHCLDTEFQFEGNRQETGNQMGFYTEQQNTSQNTVPTKTQQQLNSYLWSLNNRMGKAQRDSRKLRDETATLR
jgi:hypothetical protein